MLHESADLIYFPSYFPIQCGGSSITVTGSQLGFIRVVCRVCLTPVYIEETHHAAMHDIMCYQKPWGYLYLLALVVKFRQREVCCSQMSGIKRFRQEIRTVSHENKIHVLKSSIFQII